MAAKTYTIKPFTAGRKLQIEYAKELNPQQLEAVTSDPGPALVIAGAGSGKTRTLTYRVAYLIEQGVPAERILLLTFTNKAAKEMLRRVGDLIQSDISQMWGGTFHHMANRGLRRHAKLLGFPNDYTILDREDARDLLNALIVEAKIDTKKQRFPKGDVLADIYSMAVNTEKPIRQVVGELYPHFGELTEQIEKLQPKYQERKKKNTAMDYDDLLAYWLRLLQEQAEIRERYAQQFQFVLVDEYQDTNKIQADMIDLMASAHKHLMVVGDDSQSIYSWRGANFQNIIEFPKRYPGCQVFKIETNYRSVPEILEVANAAIAPNRHQFPKKLRADRKPGSKPVLVPAYDVSQQAAFVAQRMLELHEEGVSLNEMAVLYRSHYHAMELQMELTRRNLPFLITSGLRFFEQAHIKDVAAYLKIVVNPADELSFKRAAKLMRGIGDKAADKIWLTVAGKPNFLQHLNSPPVVAAVPAKARADWKQFVATLCQIDPLKEKPAEMIRVVVEAGYEDYLTASFPNYAARLEDLNQLALFAQKYENSEQFLSELALMTNLEAEDTVPVQAEDELVRLSTVHQAKGLEWKVVFLIWLADGMFPNARALNSPDGEEEERRLFYVAITRGKDELYLVYPQMRFNSGYQDVLQKPSRFLQDIPKELLDQFELKSQFASY
jgi:DNA helicase-2/ATP-dependent DNA helicase PcrA